MTDTYKIGGLTVINHVDIDDTNHPINTRPSSQFNGQAGLGKVPGNLYLRENVDDTFSIVTPRDREPDGDWLDLTGVTRSRFRTEGGWMDYNDTSTTTTPVVLSAGVETYLPNDGLGTFTNKTYKPISVDELVDTSTGYLDFSDLVLGDELYLRLDVTPTTTLTNTDISIGIELGAGAGAYTLWFLREKGFKTATTHANEIVQMRVHMGNTNTLNNVGKFVMVADKASTVVVNGVYVSVN